MDDTYARLIWVTDEGPQTYLLNPGQVVTLGREPDNGVVIPLGSISRKHAQIEWNGSSYTLTDLGSANGTFINGTRIGVKPEVLRNGDIIQLHTLVVRFLVILSLEDPFDFAPDAREFRQLQTRQRLHVTSKLPNSEDGSDETIIAQWSEETELLPETSLRRLIVSTGPDAGQAFDLNKPILTIGCAAPGAAWEIQLNDTSISNPHARLELVGDEYQLSDLRSATGTRLNQEILTAPALLKEGDVIELGTVRLIYST